MSGQANRNVAAGVGDGQPSGRRYLAALWRMSRPSQLLAVALVYAYGLLIARAAGSRLPWAEALAGGLLVLVMSASIHFANEYADAETDARTVRTPFSGGSGALGDYRLPPAIALKAAWTALSVAAGLSLLYLLLGALNAAALAFLWMGGFLGWMYSLGPLRLAWRGWGELDNALLGGFVLPACGFAFAAGRFAWALVPILAPFAGLVFLNLLATTWPDREADGSVGKRTLATRLSPVSLRVLYGAVAVCIVAALLFVSKDHMPPPAYAWSLAVLPLMAWGAMSYTRRENPLPSVAAMVVYLLLQIFAWAVF